VNLRKDHYRALCVVCGIGCSTFQGYAVKSMLAGDWSLDYTVRVVLPVCNQRGTVDDTSPLE
jgi:hypothetical protein